MYWGSYHPLGESELSLLNLFCAGEHEYAEALRNQVGNAVYTARQHDAPWLGILPRPRTHIVHKPAITLIDGASEYDDLGERRYLAMADVGARTPAGVFIRCQLEIDHGHIQALRILGAADEAGGVLRSCLVRLDSVSLADVFYVEGSPDTVGQRVAERPMPFPDNLGIPQSLPAGSEWQRWLYSLDSVRRTRPKGGYLKEYQSLVRPLAVRRAQPASMTELGEFETRNSLKVSEELREFWEATNGMYFLNVVLNGTHDADVTIDEYGRARRVVLTASPLYGDVGLLVSDAVSSDEERPLATTIKRVDRIHSQEPAKRWPSLRSFMEYWLDRGWGAMA